MLEFIGLRYSPPLEAMKIRLTPSPSPLPSTSLQSDDSDSNHGGLKHMGRREICPSHGDTVLVSLMGGGSHPEVARQAGAQPLASYTEVRPAKGTRLIAMKHEVKEQRRNAVSPPRSMGSSGTSIHESRESRDTASPGTTNGTPTKSKREKRQKPRIPSQSNARHDYIFTHVRRERRRSGKQQPRVEIAATSIDEAQNPASPDTIGRTEPESENDADSRRSKLVTNHTMQVKKRKRKEGSRGLSLQAAAMDGWTTTRLPAKHTRKNGHQPAGIP